MYTLTNIHEEPHIALSHPYFTCRYTMLAKSPVPHNIPQT